MVFLHSLVFQSLLDAFLKVKLTQKFKKTYLVTSFNAILSFGQAAKSIKSVEYRQSSDTPKLLLNKHLTYIIRYMFH